MARAWVLFLAGLVASAQAVTYPNYNTSPKPADATGMSSTAWQIAGKMRHGINIGNTLEAQVSETNWGNPKITQAYVDFIKAKGFNAVRLPCAWDQYANQTTAQIDPTWLARVKEVVNYCVKNDLYVFVNIHWDGGWLEKHVNPTDQDAVNAKQKAYWQQIATLLRDFDEHVMFASANEPDADNAQNMAVLNVYHQTFVDAVRSTGGKNAYRNLIIQGPQTDFEKTYNLFTNMPKDTVPDRLFAEVHYYTPWSFCGLQQDESWGKMFYYWGAPNHSPTDTNRNPTWGEEADLDKFFGMMKTKFIDKNIPVIVGEYSTEDRKNDVAFTPDNLKLHEASRALWTKLVTQKALSIGHMTPFYWDKKFLLDRSNYVVLDQPILDAIMADVGPTTAPTTPTPTTSKVTTAPVTTPTPTTSTVTPTPTTTATPTGGVKLWGQCGGIGYSGPTTCAEGKCVKSNDWYSQCVL